VGKGDVIVGCFVIIAASACGSSRPPGDPVADPAAMPAASQPAANQHLLLVVRAVDHRLEVVSARIAPVPMPLDRAPLAAAPDAWHVELLDAAGASMVATDLRPPDVVRGEFAANDGTMDAHRVTVPTTEFLVRFPVTPGAASILISTSATGGTRSARHEIGRAPLPPVAAP
jgi:hypothetical protein